MAEPQLKLTSISAMEQRPCGTSGLTLPVMGLGTWAFGGGAYWGPQDQTDVDDVVARALDRGITYFDTAEMYNAGASETSLGHALKGRRDQAIIGSKVSPSNTRPATLRACCEASLRRLQTDTIDLYMVHWPINAKSLPHFTQDEEVLKNPPSTAEAFLALNELRREGKIRHIGVSNFGVQQLKEVISLGVPIAVNELPYNLLMRAIEAEILPFCRSSGIGVLGYMTLMQGVLGGTFASFDELPPPRTRTRHFSGKRTGSRHGEEGIEAETWTALEAIRVVAREEQISVADLAIAWALSNRDVCSVLAGCRNRAQLESNAESVTRRLSAGTMARLDGATSTVLSRLGTNPDYYQGRTNARIW